MSISAILFYFLSAMALGSAIMVVVSKNAVHSVLWLIVTFFAISGHYILMNAQFLGIVNLIVYAGAIMVLFLFVIMLMNLNADVEPKKKSLVKNGWDSSRRMPAFGIGCRFEKRRSPGTTGAIQ